MKQVAVGAEGKQRLDLVTTVRSFDPHVEREVELGGSRLAEANHSVTVTA